ncbi:ABC transporter ATP-binding protein [Actinoplanes sp. SE50]|uniref:metal ABC transporter ATP-binding protein n=1 Tax=unclassified Actinoplanes TaxID=2626549 RepID=UPI00023ED526|nr:MULTISPECIES: metal ABC transporter ATP-binding protein [unclassified Actinoplanes]AEV81164.1 manganese/zinc/iron transport system ATP- binding protein [Actinoplanes sp. SE50/110]ATO79565.1 ABC transporter ATP-binding protein [Actinoplanes sp. SE50]SLL96966.1 ABC transporter ATP-binding protein [Actinoplanes sp. SE50/110]
MTAAFTYSQVSIGYQGTPVLTHVDLTLAPGQRLALVGPNGAGKSTLIKSMLGLVPVLGGAVTVLGDSPAAARGRAGYVPQTDTLDADFPVSVRQVVMMGRYRRIGWWRPAGRYDRQAVADALEQVGLPDRAAHRFGTLSGGQRQRVLLARAIAAEPRLLLLDEPFNGVDAVSQDAIVRVLRELSAGGAALVFSTHDLQVARDLADQVCLINGRQWAAGAPAKTLTADNLRRTYAGSAIDLADGRMVLVEP